jgi:SagB-type dehydrogenase family enzyme
MAARAFSFSPYCVFVPDADGQSITVVHSLHGSRFRLDADFCAALLTGDDAPQSGAMSGDAWERAIADLVREQLLIDQRSRRRIERAAPFTNGLGPIELAVLRGPNEGGVKRTTEGAAPPAMKPATKGRAIDLDGPTGGGIEALAATLAKRQSIRTYSSRALDRARLGEFLHLTARAHAHVETPGLGTTSLRNYPGGGARYPLEVYPVALNVRGVPRGVYHYHAFHHRLEQRSRDVRYVDALRQQARFRMSRPAGDASEPAVLFIVTAVFARTCWKYEGIPLPLILQETGALYQTMYLAASAMNLAPCAVGAFPERAVGEILGLDATQESQVGLFALGVPAESAPGPQAITIERFAVRKGSPFAFEPSRHSVELVFADGATEIVDAGDFVVTESAGRFFCVLGRGRRRGVFAGAALASLRRLMRSRDGTIRIRIGRTSIVVGTDAAP